MRKIKKGKFKFCLRVLSIILILNMIIGNFPKGLVIADTVISGDVDIADIDTNDDIDVIDTRKASDTNADYLGKVKFYDYYGSNKIGTIGNNEIESKNGYHYYFEKFNHAVSNYSRENNIMYPLYFGDFNSSAGESNNPEQNPTEGQTLMGNAYKFFWAANRASRSANPNIPNSTYTASVQGLVSDTLQYDELTKESKLTQDIKTINFADPGTQSKNFNISSVTVKDNAKYEDLKGTDIFKRRNVGKITYPGATGSKQDFRVEFKTGEGNFSGYDKYLTFDVYNENKYNNNYAGGSLFVAIKDSHGNKMAGWTKYYGTEYYDNTIERDKWQTIVVDLEELKQNNNNKDHGTNFPDKVDFSKIQSVFIGYWQPAYIFIDKDSFKFLGDIKEKGEGTVELPYFNSQFLSDYNAGTTTNEYEFPFKMRTKTVTDISGNQNVKADYYIFSSGKSGYVADNSTLTDVVRINKTTNHLDYWFDVADNDKDTIVKDMNGEAAGFGGTGDNEPGFFPFNTPDQGGNLDVPNSYTENGLNYGFGAKIEIQFKLTEDGTATTAERMQIPLEFNFKGDDDVWVYVDGQLALDMGGGHSQTEGNINFATGIATVKNVVEGKITSNSLSQPVVTKTKRLRLPDEYYIDGNPENGYDIDKIHTITLFYMERGMIESNLYMDFNFVPSENELIVEKEVDTSGVNEALLPKTEEIASGIEFKFNVFENNNVKKGIDYVHSESSYNRRTDEVNGKFILKDKNTATFLNKFSEESKVYFSEDEDNRFTTSWRWKSGENISEEYTEGNETTDVTIPKSQEIFEKYTYHAIFKNTIKTGKLSIKKDIKLLEEDDINKYTDDVFNFKVEFTSILGTALNPAINYNGKYYVLGNGIDGEVEKTAIKDSKGNWLIQLNAGQTAEIRNIPIDTEYTIQEILDDKYKIESINGQNTNGSSSISGKITDVKSENKITYVNKKILRDLQIIKVDNKDSNKKLEGAKFILNKLKEDGSIDGDFNQREVTSDKNGQADFIDLPYGKYMLTEIEAPEGYELLKEPIKFEINDSNKTPIINIEVQNKESIKLPVTGGSGTIKNNYIGLLLISLSTALYLAIKGRKYRFI